jgi:hypothetical protein
MEDAVHGVSAEAKQANVDLFSRFAVMRNGASGTTSRSRLSLSPDLLHMNDWSYGCIAKLLVASTSEAAARPFACARAAGVHPLPRAGIERDPEKSRPYGTCA